MRNKQHLNNMTYLTTEELSEKIKYEPRTIRNTLKDAVLIEGTHYIRPFGGRKILYLWENVQRAMHSSDTQLLMTGLR